LFDGGNSIYAAARLIGVSKTTILKFIEDAGRAAVWYQGRVLQNLKCTKMQANTFLFLRHQDGNPNWINHASAAPLHCRG
jgi:hypothetical protein